MSEKKPGSTEATVMGLPEVSHGSARAMDPDETVRKAPVMDPDETVRNQPTHDLLPPASTAPSLDQVTSPSLAPVMTPPAPPPRTKTAGQMRATADVPRTRTGGAIPKAPDAPRRPSRLAHATQPIEVAQTSEVAPVPTAELAPVTSSFEWTMPRVAGLAGAVGLVFIGAWVFWPSNKPTRTHSLDPEPIALEEPVPTPKPAKPSAPVVAPVAAAPSRPTLKLDAKKHVIDPFAAHLADVELDPAHKYRLSIERDDSRVGTALARLDEKGGWGVMRKMASHAVLQFGGAKALRMHCEPGTRFRDGQTLPLELVDLANKQKTPLPVNPAQHCWDFEVARVMELGEGVKKRVRVPTDSKVVLGEKVPLRVAFILESLGDKKEWRTGVLNPGESVLAEGRMARFAILDPYAGDNEGTLELEILSGDTENSGLVTPSATGAEFVVPTPK